MITALAVVTSVDVTDEGNQVELSCEQQTSCSHCSSRGSCATGIASKAAGKKTHKWRLMTDKDVEVGQIVEIGLSERNLVQYASIIYLLPIIALLLGAAISEVFLNPWLNTGEGLTIAVSALFLVTGIFLAKSLSSKVKSSSLQSVSLIRVLKTRL